MIASSTAMDAMHDGAVMLASPSTELHWLPSDDTTTQEEAVYLYAIEKIYIYSAD